MTASRRTISSLCVYCGSSTGNDPAFAEAARTLGRELATRQVELVYGGGRRGLMGILADSVLEAGGSAIGVIPQTLVELEVAHRGLSELHIVRTMHERKAEMSRRADAFLVLPGAWGTLDEMFEALTWAQLGIHHKPCGLWNVGGYYDLLVQFFDRMSAEALLKDEDRTLLIVGEDLGDILDRLAEYQVPAKGRPAKLGPQSGTV